MLFVDVAESSEARLSERTTVGVVVAILVAAVVVEIIVVCVRSRRRLVQTGTFNYLL